MFYKAEVQMRDSVSGTVQFSHLYIIADDRNAEVNYWMVIKCTYLYIDICSPLPYFQT